MPKLLRMVEIGGKSVGAWVNDGGSFLSSPRSISVTFTIDSEPYRRRPLDHWTQQGREEQALEYFKEWLRDELGVSMDPPGGASLADELAKLAELRSKGMLSESEFEEAKRKLLKN